MRKLIVFLAMVAAAMQLATAQTSEVQKTDGIDGSGTHDLIHKAEEKLLPFEHKR